MSTLINKNKIATLKKQKEKALEDDVNYLEEVMNVAIKNKDNKQELIERLQRKIDRMQDRKVITEMKQEDYKRLFDYFNIMILIFSAILTVLEAIKNDIDVERSDEPIKQFFKLTPLIIATGIGLITAIIKFKQFQETMETNTKAIEKSIFTTFRMKKLQEDLHFADDPTFIKIREIYKEEIFPLYNQAQEELEGTLKHKDIIKYSSIKKKLENEGNKKLLKLQRQEDDFNDRYGDDNLHEHDNFRLATTQDSGTTHNSIDMETISIPINSTDTSKSSVI
jgi:hypothetical protein